MKYTLHKGVHGLTWLQAINLVLLVMAVLAMSAFAYESVSKPTQGTQTPEEVQSTDLEVKDAHTSSDELQPAARAYYAQPSISGEYLQFGDGSRWKY